MHGLSILLSELSYQDYRVHDHALPKCGMPNTSWLIAVHCLLCLLQIHSDVLPAKHTSEGLWTVGVAVSRPFSNFEREAST